MSPVIKALLPAAGLGTRFLPATKASPKEMLPIVDKPMIQYAVEEAEACGINEFIIVTGRHKRSIEDHFDTVYELEEDLKQKGKKKLLEMINRLSNVDFAYIRQGRPLGLGHAILRAKPFVKNEPVAVLLSDDVIDPQESLLKTMINLYDELDCPIVALEEVPREEIHRYGVIEGTAEGKDLYRITNFVEKPRPEDAPSNLAIIGRYILTPDIFKILETMKPGRGGEYQLTDALQLLLKKRSVYGFVFRGKRYDAGDKFGFLKATVDLALKSSNVAEQFRDYILHVAEKIKKEEKQK
ncbi:UTP--glucose-1-phosphate uridylyltransferase [hydrothermal vent metagenome]|uniref:UTP--glucose-1-phosphate uridylyltransferase n=1 Tax=hydrothermal vent metagenome TaxID=652676 RepID=A0A3B1D0P1_9ZZZZ